MLHARRARNVSLSKNRDDVETGPTSVDVVHVIPHEAQLALSRVRAVSNISDDTLAALIESRSLSSNTLTHSGGISRVVSEIPTIATTSSLCKIRLWHPRINMRVVIVRGDYNRKRLLSISYANGNTEIEEPVVECEGERRPSVVALKWGKDLDDVIPGMA